jgi:hypothetical protein
VPVVLGAASRTAEGRPLRIHGGVGGGRRRKIYSVASGEEVSISNMEINLRANEVMNECV